MNKGIDISAYQNSIDWDMLSADFVIVRAGYGKVTSQKDKLFEQHYANAKMKGIPVGVYWYSYAKTPEEAKQEAEACLEIIKGKTFEYPIYFDIEEDSQYKLGKTAVSAMIKAFCETLEKAGYFAGFYTSASWYNNVITDEIKQRFTCWIAHWNVSKPNINGQYGLWQYKVAPVAGISGDVDQDYGIQDFPTLIKNAGLNGFNKTTPVSKNEIDVTLSVDGKQYKGKLKEV